VRPSPATNVLRSLRAGDVADPSPDFVRADASFGSVLERLLDAHHGQLRVVDDGGHLLALERLDNTFPAAAPISIEKARSAAVFRKPTADFENAVKNGRVSLVANQELLPLEGGVPIVVGGQVIGAVGVAGAASAQQDDDIARAAAGSLQ